MSTCRIGLLIVFAIAMAIPSVDAQDSAEVAADTAARAIPAAATRTIWQSLGIPQGLQKIRDVAVNCRGNHPALERKPPLKRIADPANLESPNPAIKAAAEIKQAEDEKQQKIKALKYLATIGCGCYDKDGKITEALIAATDDCTPDVREAALKAIDDASSRECCRKCGSTSCCNEKISTRLSEIAYERDDSGCPAEPNAEMRSLAERILLKCCPGGPPSGPIEEGIPEEPSVEEPEQVPTPKEQPEEVKGESSSDEDEDVMGESSEENVDNLTEEPPQDDNEDIMRALPNSGDGMEDSTSDEPDEVDYFQDPFRDDTEQRGNHSDNGVQPQTFDQLLPPHAADAESLRKSRIQWTNQVSPLSVLTVGGIPFKSARLEPVDFESQETEHLKPAPRALQQVIIEAPVRESPEIQLADLNRQPTPSRPEPSRIANRQPVAAIVKDIDHRTGEILVTGSGLNRLTVGASVVVYHRYLLGEEMVGHLVIKQLGNGIARAQVMDAKMLKEIHRGDRAFCQ